MAGKGFQKMEGFWLLAVEGFEGLGNLGRILLKDVFNLLCGGVISAVVELHKIEPSDS